MVEKSDIDKLRLKVGQLITEDWFDDLGDVLEELAFGGAVSTTGDVYQSLIPHGYVTLGDEEHHFAAGYIDDIYAEEVNAEMVSADTKVKTAELEATEVNADVGNFSVDLLVQGKKVIKDEDPIFIKEFLSPADYQLYDKAFQAMKYAILELEPLLVDVKKRLSRIVALRSPLDANEIYLSDWIRCDEFDKVVGVVYTDVDGTLTIQFSADGTQPDCAEQIVITGGTRTCFSVEIVAEYVRIRYKNGTTPQTTFRLTAYLKR